MGDLKTAKNYALSDSDIRQILGDDIKIVTYPELGNMSSINECFDKKGRCILLFLISSPTSGHWCCMLRKKKGIHFFDPYGEAPDDQKDCLPKSRLEQLDENQPYLTDLLRKSGRPVFYNRHPFQVSRDDITTCGRHCIVRCLYGSYSIPKYASIIKSSGLSADDFVTGLTYDFLKK